MGYFRESRWSDDIVPRRRRPVDVGLAMGRRAAVNRQIDMVNEHMAQLGLTGARSALPPLVPDLPTVPVGVDSGMALTLEQMAEVAAENIRRKVRSDPASHALLAKLLASDVPMLREDGTCRVCGLVHPEMER